MFFGKALIQFRKLSQFKSVASNIANMYNMYSIYNVMQYIITQTEYNIKQYNGYSKVLFLLSETTPVMT